jgi:hypothetical protein
MNTTTEKRNVRNLIVGFVKSNQDSTASEICEKLIIDTSLAHLHLTTLVNDGILSREKHGRQYVYMVCPGIYVEAQYVPELHAGDSKIAAGEAKASALLERGLPRRAATVLAELLALAKSEGEARRIIMFRKKCLLTAKQQRQESMR